MPPPPPPPGPRRAAEPVLGQKFDPWNTASSGHQRAENRLGHSTGWRDSRNAKLTSQFRAGLSGGPRVSDTVGAGSNNFDAAAGGIVTPATRARAHSSVADMLMRPGSMKRNPAISSPIAATATHTPTTTPMLSIEDGEGRESDVLVTHTNEEQTTARRKQEDEQKQNNKQNRGIFDGVVVYVNGSTHPHISDHRLKHVLAENGGRLSSHLARRQVTHVVLGRAGPGGYGSSSNSKLAAGKMEREVRRVGGRAVRYVGVEWIIECLRADKRLPEARFTGGAGEQKQHQQAVGAPAGQGSVYGLYRRRPEGQGEKEDVEREKAEDGNNNDGHGDDNDGMSLEHEVTSESGTRKEDKELEGRQRERQQGSQYVRSGGESRTEASMVNAGLLCGNGGDWSEPPPSGQKF